jgi:hypothetical protein
MFGLVSDGRIAYLAGGWVWLCWLIERILNSIDFIIWNIDGTRDKQGV